MVPSTITALYAPRWRQLPQSTFDFFEGTAGSLLITIYIDHEDTIGDYTPDVELPATTPLLDLTFGNFD